jgi:hypothetical protein
VLWKVACYENNRCDVGWCVPHYNAPPCTWIESSVAKLCSTSQEYGTLKYYHLDEHCDCLQTMDSILSHVGLSFGSRGRIWAFGWIKQASQACGIAARLNDFQIWFLCIDGDEQLHATCSKCRIKHMRYTIGHEEKIMCKPFTNVNVEERSHEDIKLYSSFFIYFCISFIRIYDDGSLDVKNAFRGSAVWRKLNSQQMICFSIYCWSASISTPSYVV